MPKLTSQKKQRAVIKKDALPPHTRISRTRDRTGRKMRIRYEATCGHKFTGEGEMRKKFSTKEECVTWLWAREADRRAAEGDKENPVVLTVHEIVEAKAAVRRLKTSGHTITDAVDYFFQSGPGGRKPLICSAAIEMHLANLKESGRKEDYIKGQRIALNVFRATAGDLSVFDYTADVLKKWLTDTATDRKWGPLSIYNYHRDVSMLFAFLMRLELINKDPMRSPLFDFVKKLKEKADDDREVQIYTPAEAAALLRAAMEMPHQKLLPRLVFQFFSGMRVDEIDRAGWDILRPEDRKISLGKKDVAKNGDPRPIPYTNAFEAWLALIPEADRVGTIVDKTNLRHRLSKLHARAGVAKKPNGPRHTFASHDYVSHGDADVTRAKIGHSDKDTLFRHYIHEVTPKQAAAFWALRPPLDVVPDPMPGDWRTKPRGPRKPSKAAIAAGFEAVTAGTVSRLALPSLFTKHATYVTAHTALYQHDLIERAPTAIHAATTGDEGTFETPFGPVHLHHLADALFCGFISDPLSMGAQIATREKALADYYYIGISGNPAFGKLPAVEVPAGFSWKTTHGFADLIANPVWRKSVHARLDAQEKDCVVLARYDN